jgi:hypothetical protein
MSPPLTTYVVDRGTGFFPELLTLLEAVQGVAVTIHWKLTGTVNFNPGDYATVEAKHLDCDLRLPLVGPIEAALQNAVPEFVHITVQPRGTPDVQFFTQGLARFTDSIFLPFLVSYHERHRAEIEARHPSGRTSWPAPWQMSWALRNAASHNGRVFDRPTQQPVSWRGLSHGPSDDATRRILSAVNGGDILVLMLEMEEARRGAPLARA